MARAGGIRESENIQLICVTVFVVGESLIEKRL